MDRKMFRPRVHKPVIDNERKSRKGISNDERVRESKERIFLPQRGESAVTISRVLLLLKFYALSHTHLHCTTLLIESLRGILPPR